MWKYVSNWFLRLIQHLCQKSQGMPLMKVPAPQTLNIHLALHVHIIILFQVRTLDPAPSI